LNPWQMASRLFPRSRLVGTSRVWSSDSIRLDSRRSDRIGSGWSEGSDHSSSALELCRFAIRIGQAREIQTRRVAGFVTRLNLMVRTIRTHARRYRALEKTGFREQPTSDSVWVRCRDSAVGRRQSSEFRASGDDPENGLRRKVAEEVILQNKFSTPTPEQSRVIGRMTTQFNQSAYPTDRCPLLGVKPTWPIAAQMSANDPRRTFGVA
jgi:hypothetical protein